MFSNNIYFSYTEKSILICLLKEHKYIDSYEIPKSLIQENLVEGFDAFLKSKSLTIKDIENIYLREIWSSWNANRLLTLFIKLVCFYGNINLYVGDVEKDFVYSDIKEIDLFSLEKNIKSFSKVVNIVEYQPFYNKCSITNT